MTEQALELMDRQAGLQLMGGVGVAQAVDTAVLADRSQVFGAVEYPLCCADTDVLVTAVGSR